MSRSSPPAVRQLLVLTTLGAILSGCGGGDSTSSAAPSSPPPTTQPSSSAPAASTSGPSTTPSPSTAPPSPAAPSATSTPSGPAASARAPAGAQAVAVLPTPGPSIGPEADEGSAERAEIPGEDLGLLGEIPAGEPYEVGDIAAEGLADSGTWPDACEMLSDADLTTLLPESGEATREGQRGNFLGGGETENFSTCKYDVPQPDDIDGVSSWVQIDLNAVADPDAVEQLWQDSYDRQKKTSAQYPDQFQDYSDGQLGGAKCFYNGNSFECAKGHFSFSVLGQYTGQGESGSDPYALKTGYLQQVVANVVKTVALRMT